jgi:hypothetical protein
MRFSLVALLVTGSLVPAARVLNFDGSTPRVTNASRTAEARAASGQGFSTASQ